MSVNPLNAGDLDRLITLQTATKTQDEDSGAEVIDWTIGAVDIWAKWLPRGTSEVWKAQQGLEAFIDGVFQIYDISPRPKANTSRIVWEGTTYDIKPPVEIGRGEGLEIPVVARVA